MKFSTRHRRALTALALAGVATLAACSSSGGGTSSGSSAVTGSTGSTGAASSGSAATGQPFRIGWANMDNGQIPLPGFTDGAQAAVQYINSQLGGINGRKVELVTCSVDSTPETNQQCGQKFANDSSLDMTMMGITLGGGPFYQALAPTGLPTLGISPVTPADFVAPANVLWYTSGGAGTYVALAKIAGMVKAKTVAYLQLDNAGGQAGLAQFKALTKDMGLQITSVAVPATATDVLPMVTQSGAATADYVVVGVSNCLPVAKALQTVGAKGKVASVNSCFAAATITGNPTLFEGWYDPSYIRNPLEGTGQDKDMDTFIAEYPKYAKLKADPTPANAQDGWAGILTLRNALKGMSTAQMSDKAAVLAALKKFPGPVVLGPDSLDCSGKNADYKSVCTLDSVIEQVHNGKFVLQHG